MIYSIAMLPVVAISMYDDFRDFEATLLSLLCSLFIGFLLYLGTLNSPNRNQAGLKEGFLIVVLYWLVIGSVGSLPFYLAESIQQQLSIVDALFESFSGLTTTGATILTNIDSLSLALLYYRQQLQWLGGMGIIVLAIAILPALGVGSVQMFRAEIAGPFKTSKIAPRASQTAKRLWYLYVGFTVCCALAYWIAGMTLFDAILHSFATLSIGGFSPYDNNIAHFDNVFIEIVAIVFMIIAGINFALHYSLLSRPSLSSISNYWRESECRVYLIFLFLVALSCVVILEIHETYDDLGETLRYGIFSAVSVATTTGFTNSNWSLWPLSLPILLIIACFIGGCSGSTAGGIKIIRLIMAFKQAVREVWLLIHPNAIKAITLNQSEVNDRVASSIWGFFFIYLFTFVFLLVLLLLDGNPFDTAFATLSACINNLGPSINEIHQNYQPLTQFTKLVLTAAMLIGRLEFYTLLVILSPVFWRT